MGKKDLVKETIFVVAIILFYYIVGSKNVFVFVLSLSLYNIFSSYLKNISFKENFSNAVNIYQKYKLFKIGGLIIMAICLLFVLLSIFVSDISSTILNINHTFLPFLFMGLSLISEPLMKLITDYLETTRRRKTSLNLYNINYYMELILFLAFSLFAFKILKTTNEVTYALLYLPKIVSLIITSVLFSIIIKKDKIYSKLNKNNKTLNIKLNIKNALTNNIKVSTINIVKQSYFYVSIIILYFILKNRYHYPIPVIEKDITFIYFYFLIFINYIISVYETIILNNKFKTITNNIFYTIKFVLPIIVMTSIVSPLITKIIFNTIDRSSYLVMLNIQSIFIVLYDITSKNLSNQKYLSFSLLSGIVVKLIIMIPVIDSFYRMGYNLVLGDILSTIIGMLGSIIINYILAENKASKHEEYLDKVLNIFYENIILTIILIVLQFIVPIKTNSYFKAILILILYLSIGFGFLSIKGQYEKEKRGN